MVPCISIFHELKPLLVHLGFASGIAAVKHCMTGWTDTDHVTLGWIPFANAKSLNTPRGSCSFLLFFALFCSFLLFFAHFCSFLLTFAHFVSFCLILSHNTYLCIESLALFCSFLLFFLFCSFLLTFAHFVSLCLTIHIYVSM